MFIMLTIDQLRDAIKYYNESFDHRCIELRLIAEAELNRRLTLIEKAKGVSKWNGYLKA